MGLQAGAGKEAVVALRLRSAFMSGVTESGRAENFGRFAVSMLADHSVDCWAAAAHDA